MALHDVRDSVLSSTFYDSQLQLEKYSTSLCRAQKKNTFKNTLKLNSNLLH